MRTILVLLLFAVGLLSFAPASLDSAPPHAVGVVSNEVISDFPNGLIARTQLQLSEPLVVARLYVSMDGVSNYTADATLPAHDTTQPLSLEVRWNGLSITRDPTPPWMPVQIWWEFIGASGEVTTTPRQQVIYSDTIHRTWQATEGVRVSVYTYGLSASAVNTLVSIGDTAMGQLQATYGYALPYRPALVFYNSSADGDNDLGRGTSIPFGGFVVGRAYPGTSGVVMLYRNDNAYLNRTITHELAHLHQYQIGMRLFEAPHWWIEGDAKAQEPTASIQRSLNHTRNVAVSSGLPNLNTWDTRNYNTEAELENALLIGASFITYLREIHGGPALAQFYGNWQGTGSFQEAFMLTFGRSLDMLSIDWQNWILNNNTPNIASLPANDTPNIPAVLLPEIPDGMARVNAYWLNFRTAPNLEDEVIQLLSIGQLVLPLGRDESGEWLLVELQDGAQGWLFAEFIDYDGNIADLTVSLY